MMSIKKQMTKRKRARRSRAMERSMGRSKQNSTNKRSRNSYFKGRIKAIKVFQ